MIQLPEKTYKRALAIIGKNIDKFSKRDVKELTELRNDIESVMNLLYDNEYSSQYFEDSCDICNNQFTCKKKDKGKITKCEEFDDVYG